jgi:hypothetical protein
MCAGLIAVFRRREGRVISGGSTHFEKGTRSGCGTRSDGGRSGRYKRRTDTIFIMTSWWSAKARRV